MVEISGYLSMKSLKKWCDPVRLCVCVDNVTTRIRLFLFPPYNLIHIKWVGGGGHACMIDGSCEDIATQVASSFVDVVFNCV